MRRPFQILGLMVVRKMLDMVFSQHDLAWMDDLLPEKEKKKKDDDKKKGREKEKRRPKQDDSEEEVRNSDVCRPLLERRIVTQVSDDVCVCLLAGQSPRLLQPLAKFGVRPGPQVLCPQTAHPLQRPGLSRCGSVSVGGVLPGCRCTRCSLDHTPSIALKIEPFTANVSGLKGQFTKNT